MKKQYSRVCAKIDLDAVLYNMEMMRRNLKENTKIMAIIKADGYGHGAAPIAKAIDHLPYLYGYGVASAEEGLILRKHGIDKPILILGYVFPEWYEELIEADIRMTLFTWEMAQELDRTAKRLGKKCKVHLAVDTGMGRIGYQAGEQAAEEMARIGELPHIMIEGIFTHFARADEADKSHAYIQLARFQEMIELLSRRGLNIPIRHCSNSAGIMEIPEANLDIVRAGITLYGLWPSAEADRSKLPIRPVMSLVSHISYVKELPAGRAVSYGGTYVTDGARMIATIPIGYADGYARGLSNKGSVLIHGKRAPVCGRVCMDQFMVDVTGIPDVKIGDQAVLLGTDGMETITMEELGELSGRFNYEFACGIGKRVPRIYIQDGETIDTKEDFL